MCWEKNVSTIVMLTQCTDRGIVSIRLFLSLRNEIYVLTLDIQLYLTLLGSNYRSNLKVFQLDFEKVRYFLEKKTKKLESNLHWALKMMSEVYRCLLLPRVKTGIIEHNKITFVLQRQVVIFLFSLPGKMFQILAWRGNQMLWINRSNINRN